MAGVSPEFFEAAEEEEEQTKSPLMLLLVIFIAIVVIALGVFALYRYQPDTFAKIAFWEHKTVDSIKPKPVVVSKPDTLATDSLSADSLKKDTTAVKDTTAAKKTEVIISQTEVPSPKKQLLATVVPPKRKMWLLYRPARAK
ncbi:hypothetical protein HK413_09290 [Mucilaginibacter sp. S1162]|uniref:Energy transducer TonB n=1 Tax=Mucilaginibacter humi TaxID=2732510 RepID=A0ABX1W3V2_9SPHI|nr:hypothetical protein [Mucilaginibacter humi]NNU34293.1 hypothetical protein [Mucilaginibacter humi]